MLVHFATIWHCIYDNFAGIIVSYYRHLFHLRSLASEFLQPWWNFSLPKLTLRCQFGFKDLYSSFINSDYLLEKRNSFLFVTSQMFLTQFHAMLFLCGEQHVQYHSLPIFTKPWSWIFSNKTMWDYLIHTLLYKIHGFFSFIMYLLKNHFFFFWKIVT